MFRKMGAFIKNYFVKHFSFDSGIDLNNEVEVLYRRNIVIKNIIFISNILYSVILFSITIGDAGTNLNWLWSVIPLPLTFALTMTINKIINVKENSLVNQQIGMYICSFYMFLSSFLVYFKMSITPSTIGYAEAGYILMYYALVVIAFYQNTKMLRNIFLWYMAIMTVIHFTLTHNFFSFESSGIIDFFNNVVPNHPEAISWFRDIIFRTLIMLLFMMAMYVITRISERMAIERRNELKKRRDIQEDFTDVVSDLYNVLLETKVGYDQNNKQSPLVAKMSVTMGSFVGLDAASLDSLKEYALFNETHELKLDLNVDNSDEEKFERLREQTAIGKTVSRRMQLSQKAENIVRAHLEGWATDDFKAKMKRIQANLESQIILLTEIYVTLRMPTSYKRPYPHHIVMDYFNKEFQYYFDPSLYRSFVRFNKDFETMYDAYDV